MAVALYILNADRVGVMHSFLPYRLGYSHGEAAEPCVRRSKDERVSDPAARKKLATGVLDGIRNYFNIPGSRVQNREPILEYACHAVRSIRAADA